MIIAFLYPLPMELLNSIYWLQVDHCVYTVTFYCTKIGFLLQNIILLRFFFEVDTRPVYETVKLKYNAITEHH